MFTKEQISEGLKLAQAWYEGWRLDELEPEQLIEAIEKAPLAPSGANEVRPKHPRGSCEGPDKWCVDCEPAPAETEVVRAQWVKQEDQNGCVVAALAMIVGKSYAEVKAELTPKDLSCEAYTAFTAESYLYEHGFTIAKKWKHICCIGKDRDEWPIAPFAPVHYVQVVSGSTGRAHAVVMLANGDVLDPWTDSTPRKLTDYHQVNEIAGVWPASRALGGSPQEPK